MKKYLLLLLLSAIPLTTYAGVLDFSRTTNYYGSGTQSPVLGATVLYPQAGGTGLSSATAGELNYCLKVSNNSPLTYAFGVCGSGAGGGAGTWSTTTSTVSGRLINYPNNTTDIVTVGGSATTTAKFYIDPNINQIFSTGILNIGNSVAPQSTAFGTNGGKYQLHYSTSTDDIAGWDLYNISTGTQAGIGIFFQNANSPLGGLGALQTYYGGILYSGKNWNGVPLGFGALPANSTGVLASDGAVVIGSATSTGVINFYAGSGSFNGSTMDMTIRNDGFVGIGTTTPYSKLSVAGQVVGQNFVATSTTAISTFASNVGIGTTTIFNPQAWGRLLQISNPSAVNGAGISLADQNTEWNMATYNSALRWSNGIATPSMILTNTNRLGIGTTTPGTTLSLGDTGANTSNISVTSTSTLATGINLKSGCYAVNGVCITGGGGGVAGPVTTTLEASCEPQTNSTDFAPGGAYWQPIYGWTFTNATSSRIMCNVAIPKNLAATPNISIMPYLSATSSTGTGIGIVDVSATSTGMLQNWYTTNYTEVHSASTTASKRWSLTMGTSLPLTSTTTITLAGLVTPAGGDILKFWITRYGADANDTVENDLFIPKVLVQLDTN